MTSLIESTATRVRSYSVEALIIKAGSICATLGFFAFFFVMYRTAQGYSRTPRLFPSVVLAVGMCLTLGILFRTALDWKFPDFIGTAEESSATKYLKGVESEFSLTDRAKRLSLTGVWIALFFVIARFDVLLGLAVGYIGMMYSLGIRSYKVLGVSTIMLLIFVVIVFLLLVGMSPEVR